MKSDKLSKWDLKFQDYAKLIDFLTSRICHGFHVCVEKAVRFVLFISQIISSKAGADEGISFVVVVQEIVYTPEDGYTDAFVAKIQNFDNCLVGDFVE